MRERCGNDKKHRFARQSPQTKCLIIKELAASTGKYASASGVGAYS
jgi:hypothetical protein